MSKKLVWEQKYSVGVEIIDKQHQMMFDTINLLIDTINSGPTEEKIADIIQRLVEYKKLHFQTEEKYFNEFGYEKSAEHTVLHRQFNDNLAEVQNKHKDDIFAFAFALIDFLEDWLINHLMTADQEYKECFKQHGLK